jgi:hypothetical protein
MRDALITGLSVFALIVVSVGVGELAFAGYHQTFVGTMPEAQAAR